MSSDAAIIRDVFDADRDREVRDIDSLLVQESDGGPLTMTKVVSYIDGETLFDTNLTPYQRLEKLQQSVRPRGLIMSPSLFRRVEILRRLERAA